MCDDKSKMKKKYYLSENHDSYIYLESGRCEYVDEQGKRVIEKYGIYNNWYRFLAYLIENNGVSISFEELYKHVYEYDPYDLVCTEEEHDNDDPINRCKERLLDFYKKILSPNKKDKVKFYKYVKNKGFSLIKDGDSYCVELPKQSLKEDIATGGECVNNDGFDEEISLIRITKIKGFLADKAEKLHRTGESFPDELPNELEMLFTDENNIQIKGYDSIKELIFSTEDNFVIGGEGGAGKSYLLQKLFCENNDTNAPILIYVKLNDINTCTRKENYSVIQNLLISHYGRAFWDNIVDIIENLNNETLKPVLLLDGFNEIGYGDRNALVSDYFLTNFKIVFSTRSDEGILERFDFHKVRINDISEEEFGFILQQNGFNEDYSYVPRKPLFIKLLLNTGKLNQPLDKLLINDGTVEGILHNYVLCEIDKALSGMRTNANVKRLDVAFVAYVIIPFLAYSMTIRNIYSVSSSQVQGIIDEIVVPEKGDKFSTIEDKDRYLESRNLLLGICSASNIIKQLDVYDIGEELAPNKILFDIACNLICDKNILLFKSVPDDIGECDIYSFLHQTIQEYLAQLFIYEVISAEIGLEDILFDKRIDINNLSSVFKLFSREQAYRLLEMIQCNDKYLDYRIGLLRTVWNNEIMGKKFTYGELDLSRTKESIVKYDLLEGIDILNNAKLGPVNYDFNSLFGREEGRATAILYVSQCNDGIETLSDDGIIRTWKVSSNGIRCINSKRTVFYFKNLIEYLGFYPRNFIDIIEKDREFIDAREVLGVASEALTIIGDDFNLFIKNNQLFVFDGMDLYEIPDFCTCSNIVRGFLRNEKLCVQNKNDEIILWNEVNTNTVFEWSKNAPKEIVRFSIDDGSLLTFLSVINDPYYFVVQISQNIIVYMYDDGQISAREFPDVLKKTDIIENEVVLSIFEPSVACLCCDNGSLICIFVSVEKTVDIRRFDNIHDCRVTSILLDAYDLDERNYIYLCSCDIGGNIIISHIIENKEGLLFIDSRDIFNFEGLIRKQIIPFWSYHKGYEEIIGVNSEFVFVKGSNSIAKKISNNMTPGVMYSNKWHIFNGCLYNYAGNMECETIPQNVRVIGKYAFANSKIKSLRIPDSVEIIEDYAFENSDIKTINFPLSIVSIGDYAFSKCGNLEDISFISEKLCLGKECFSNSGIKRIYFDKGDISVGERCFSKCLNLEQLIINNCIGEIGKYSFSSCEKLNYIELGNCLEVIGDGAFVDCRNLRSIQIPETIKCIGKAAFGGCENLKKAILLSGLRDVSLSLFQECYGLEIIVVSNEVERIYDVLDEKCLCFDSGIMYASVCLLATDLAVKIMNKHFYDTEILEKKLYDIIWKNNRLDLFKDEIQKRMPKSDATFMAAYHHNPTWARYILDEGFDVATLAKVFYNAISEANIELVEILLSGISDIYFIEKYDCFSIYNALDIMFRKGGDTISVVECLIKNGLIISETIVEMILATGAPDVLDFFLKYLFEINYFDGIQNFLEKIEYLTEMNKVREVVDFGSIEKYLSYIMEHLNDPIELAYQKFLSDNLDLRDRIGVGNWDNNTVLNVIRESYIKYYKI